MQVSEPIQSLTITRDPQTRSEDFTQSCHSPQALLCKDHIRSLANNDIFLKNECLMQSLMYLCIYTQNLLYGLKSAVKTPPTHSRHCKIRDPSKSSIILRNIMCVCVPWGRTLQLECCPYRLIFSDTKSWSEPPQLPS